MRIAQSSIVAAFGLALATAGHAQIVSSGSGFAINARGDVLTNAHVLLYEPRGEPRPRACARFEVAGPGLAGFATVVVVSPAHDLAVINIDPARGRQSAAAGRPGGAAAAAAAPGARVRTIAEIEDETGGRPRADDAATGGAALGGAAARAATAQFAARPVQAGQPVVAIGFPLEPLLSDQAKVATGIVAATAGPDNNVTLLQHTVPINPGSSGGPLLDQTGAVIGINVSGISPQLGVQNVNFAIHGRTAVDFFAAFAIPHAIARGGDTKPTEAIARDATAYTVKILCHAS